MLFMYHALFGSRRVMRHNLFYSLFVYRLLNAALKGFFQRSIHILHQKFGYMHRVLQFFLSVHTERKK